jgi:hypothetical protein
MSVTPYELYQHLLGKGYVVPMEGQIAIDDLSPTAAAPTGMEPGKVRPQVQGGRLKGVMEIDRRNVYKAYFGEGEQTESTWIAGEEQGRGMMLPLWAERLIHADVLVMQEKIDSTIEYLMHHMGKQDSK